jgi:hypothetical protein
MDRFSNTPAPEPSRTPEGELLSPRPETPELDATSFRTTQIPSRREQFKAMDDMSELLSERCDWMFNDQGMLELLIDRHGQPLRIIQKVLENGLELVNCIKAVVGAWYSDQKNAGMVETWLFIDDPARDPQGVERHISQRTALTEFFKVHFAAETTWTSCEDRGKTHWILRVPEGVFVEPTTT